MESPPEYRSLLISCEISPVFDGVTEAAVLLVDDPEDFLEELGVLLAVE